MFKTSSSVSYFRNFIFGVEDSLVSTVGLLSGVAIAGATKETIVLAGIVLIFVEAFSMAAGSFLSESSAEEYMTGTDGTQKNNLKAGLIMFCSYFVSGFIPLSSYLIWPINEALKFSIIFSIGALLILGAVSSQISKTSIIKGVWRMFIVGGTAIAIGIGAGSIVSSF